MTLRARSHIILVLVVSVLALVTGCTGKTDTLQGSGDDSTYTWENIRKYLMEEPAYALALVDTAQMRGLADVNYANQMRAHIYYESPVAEDLPKARELCLDILENKDPEADDERKLKTLSLLVNICAYVPDTYQDAINYAIKGAEMAHQAGDILQEAGFYFESGKVMEHLQQGSGIKYMNRSLDIYRAAARDGIQPLPTLCTNLGNAARILSQQENYTGAIPLLKEKLQVISRIEKEYASAPAGWIDQQRAQTYTVLAYAQQMTGDKEGARRSAEAFEQTQAARQPAQQKDILNYYALSGNSTRIQQIYDGLEPYYRQTEDTISWRYADLLYLYALGLSNTGRYREAYQAQFRYQVLSDSLVQRERREETLQYAQQMKTQEKELQLKDEEAKTKVYRILAFSLTAFLLVIVIALWLLVSAHRQLLQKNRELYNQFVRQMEKERESLEHLECRPLEERSPAQQLFLRLTELMRKEQPYTDADLNRDTLAAKMGTNHRYIDEAIRACSDSPSTGAFINGYRVDHAARLLSETDEPVNLIAEMSGFASRAYFNEKFRERFKMTPSEFRKASGK